MTKHELIITPMIMAEGWQGRCSCGHTLGGGYARCEDTVREELRKRFDRHVAEMRAEWTEPYEVGRS